MHLQLSVIITRLSHLTIFDEYSIKQVSQKILIWRTYLIERIANHWPLKLCSQFKKWVSKDTETTGNTSTVWQQWFKIPMSICLMVWPTNITPSPDMISTVSWKSYSSEPNPTPNSAWQYITCKCWESIIHLC